MKTITRNDLFKAVAECLNEKGFEYYGASGPRYVLGGDVETFGDWGKLASKLGLPDEPKTLCNECGAEKIATSK